jgi:hypothetical protein
MYSNQKSRLGANGRQSLQIDIFTTIRYTTKPSNKPTGQTYVYL